MPPPQVLEFLVAAALAEVPASTYSRSWGERKKSREKGTLPLEKDRWQGKVTHQTLGLKDKCLVFHSVLTGALRTSPCVAVGHRGTGPSHGHLPAASPALGLSTEQLIRHRSLRLSNCRQVLCSEPPGLSCWPLVLTKSFRLHLSARPPVRSTRASATCPAHRCS